MQQSYAPFKERELPKPFHWTKALGVGVVVIGLAIGTGELIMWPHIVTKYGIHLLWLALIGILAQYFINQEVARHALARGESFFTSSARIFPPFAFFWLISAILMYIWPGWASAIGTMLRELMGFGSYEGWAIVALALVLLLTFSGSVAYKVLEGSLKVTVPIFFILLVIISFYNLNASHFIAAFQGLAHFSFPQNIDTNTLLSAIVFAGAGGLLNTCVSLWYRDKQIGMGAHVGRITNPITGKEEAVSTDSFTFKITKENMKRWKGWMRFVRIDQGIIFTLLGFITLFLLSMNAYAVLAPKGIVPEGTNLAVVQAQIFGDQWGVAGTTIFLIMATLMLFSVMWTVIDALTRIVSDVIYTHARTGPYQSFFRVCKTWSIGKLYYTSIILVCIIGALLIPLKQPLTLLTISAVLGGLTMAIYCPLLIYLNNAKLPKELRPSWFTNSMMVLISGFFLYFAVKVIQQQFFS
jgi:hypothetical protein